MVNGFPRATSRSQPAGSGCAASTSYLTYDANGNVASEDDFNGNRLCRANDLSRNLETARVEGLANTAVCSTVVTVGATLPAGSRKTSTQWHPDWRLESKRAEPLKVTTWVYNGQPDPFSGGAIASCAPSTAVLPDGKPIVVLCKQIEQATTDANGALGFSATLQAGVPNRQQSWTYNQYGQVLTATDPVNNTTTYTYYGTTTSDYTMGDLQQVTNALNQVRSYPKYNKHGQVLRMVEANGVVTDNTYDLRQRLTSTTTGGLQTVYTYDPAGQLIQVKLPDTTTIGYTWDDAHRLTKVTDQAGNSVTYTLDNAGNHVTDQIKDSSGTLARTVTRVFDALNRVQQTTGAAN
jgi:YD repeat-containing protein